MQNIDLSKQGHLFKDSRLEQGFRVKHQLLDPKVAQLLVTSGAVVHVGDQVTLTREHENKTMDSSLVPG